MEADRKKQAVALAPILRGFCSSKTQMIGHFTDDARVLEFINSNDLERLGANGHQLPRSFFADQDQSAGVGILQRMKI